MRPNQRENVSRESSISRSQSPQVNHSTARYQQQALPARARSTTMLTDRRNFQDPAESDYCDMRGNAGGLTQKMQGGSPHRSYTVSSPHSPYNGRVNPRFFPPDSPSRGAQTHYEDDDYVEVSSPPRRPPHQAPSKSKSVDDDDDSIYADMTGNGSLASSPLTSVTSSPARQAPPSRTGIFSKSMITHTRASNSPSHMPDSSIGVKSSYSERPIHRQGFRQNLSVKVRSSSSSNLNDANVQSISSPIHLPRNILMGGFNKDDDDDYQEVQTTDKESIRDRGSRDKPPQQRTTRTPAVEIRPATPDKHLMQKSPNMKQSMKHLSKKHFDFSDSDNGSSETDGSGSSSSDYSILAEDIGPVKAVRTTSRGKSKSTSAIYSETVVSVVGWTPDARTPDPRAPTDAGRAARMYLQQKDVRLSPTAGDTKFGLNRSSSRAGQSGGVKTRITKIRQNNSSKQVEDMDDEADPVHSVNHESLRKLTRASSSISDNRIAAEFHRRKSQTLTRSLQNVLEREKVTADDDKSGGVSDSSDLKKLLASESQSRSLDKKYLQWLANTSPYTSRHSSTSSSAKTSRLKNKNREERREQPSDIGSTAEESDEDEEGFIRYKKSVEENLFSQQSNTQMMLLGDYVDAHFQNKETNKDVQSSPVKKSLESASQEIKAFKKAKTPIPVSADGVGFPDIAQVFHDDYMSKQKKKDQKKTQRSTKNKSGSSDKSYTRSLRKSFKFGSKKKLNKNASCPSLDVQQSQKPNSLSLPPAEKNALSKSIGTGLNTLESPMAAGTPDSLKPPTGISPSHSARMDIRRHRSSSQSHRSNHNNNVRSSKEKARTLERGLTYNQIQKAHFASTNDVRNDQDDKYGSLKRQVSDMDLDTLDRTGKLNISKASTLGRFFSRKGKERKGLDVIDGTNFVVPDNPESSPTSEVAASDLTSSQWYFRKCRMSRGLSLNSNGEEGIEICTLASDERGRPRQAVPVNKYATITGMYASNPTQEQTPKQSLTRHLSAEQAGRSEEEIAEDNRRYKRSRSSLRGLSNSLSRNLYKSAAKQHLTIGESDELNGSDVMQAEPLQTPLKSRPRLKIGALYPEPRQKFLAAARVIFKHLIHSQPHLLREHRSSEEKDHDPFHTDDEIYPHCAMGRDLVTWFQSILQPMRSVTEGDSTPQSRSPSRWKICGMWQALHEDGLITHVRHERHFEDVEYLYQFHADVTSHIEKQVNDESPVNDDTISTRSSVDSGIGHLITESCEDCSARTCRSPSVASNTKFALIDVIPNDADLAEAVALLQQDSDDALFRLALRKLPEDRCPGELMMIYEEILHIKALAHLSDSVKRELAGVLQFEYHREKGKTLFKQGDEGRSWYIILKGSVSVSIHGKGVVCTLNEGDDFGNLALINDAPRAATIVLAEHNCQFLRVDKFDFVRILKDVEANTVRLKEHDEVVLILQKIPPRTLVQTSTSGTNTLPSLPSAATPTRQCHRYAISAGTAEKILEHILDNLQPWNIGRRDEAMEDYIIMHQVFMSTEKLCQLLLKHYRSDNVDKVEYSKSLKRRVVYFTVRWSHIASSLFRMNPCVETFLKDLHDDVNLDSLSNSSYLQLKDDLESLYTPEQSNIAENGVIKSNLLTVVAETVQKFQQSVTQNRQACLVKASDEILLKVYSLDKTYTTVKVAIPANPSQVLSALSERLNKNLDGHILVELLEDGETLQVAKRQTSIATAVKINSQLYVCKPSEIEQLASISRPPRPLPPATSHLEVVSSLEVAYHVTQYDWELVNNIHVMEFVYKIFGPHKFKAITSNLDIFARRFNQLAYWVPTEICSCPNLNKRVQLLRKFIKIAYHLKVYQNMNGFLAMMIGIGNQAVSRLYHTWDKLPAKYKKLVQEYEAILDPSRNHRSYRLHVSSLQAPIILYLPLLLKDMTFQHEGNDTKNNNGLVNFEKMHMLSNSIRSVVQGCSQGLDKDHFLKTTKTAEESRVYVRSIQVITNQKLLNEMSLKLEPRR